MQIEVNDIVKHYNEALSDANQKLILAQAQNDAHEKETTALNEQIKSLNSQVASLNEYIESLKRQPETVDTTLSENSDKKDEQTK